MFRNFSLRVWNSIVNPEVRLKADFPWGFGTMAKQYLIASLLYIVGSLIPLALLTGVLAVLAATNPEMLNGIIGGKTLPMWLIVVPTVSSFFCGFGLELWYIARCFRKQGLSLRESMALNLKSLGGSWFKAFAWAVGGFVVVAVIQQILGHLLPAPHSPAGEFARQLNGWGLAAFAVMAVIGAPVLEELVFRGFLFNVCRTSFRKGWFVKVFRTERVADYAAIAVSAFVFAAGHLSVSAIPFLFVTGVVLAAIYRRSGSLVVPMLLHGINNLVVTLVLISQVAAQA